MAYVSTVINESPVFALTAAVDFEAGAVAVTLTDDGAAIAAAGEAAVGIVLPSESGVEAGDIITVQVKDICRWTAGGAFSAGELLSSDANGAAVAASSGDYILARALEAASEAGAMAQVQIIHAGYKA